MTLPVLLGGRVGHGCAGSTIAREADEREDAGGGRGGGRNERAVGAPLAERWVAVDGEGAADVADAGGPVRGRVAIGGGAALGGGCGGAVAGTDAVPGAVPASSGPLRAGAAPDTAAAGPGGAGGGGGRGAGGGVRRGRVRGGGGQDGPDREVYFEQVAIPGREAAFDFTDASDLGVTIRGVAFRHLLFEWVLSYKCAVDAGRGAGGASSRQTCRRRRTS